jgi:hypothetical protein
MRKLIWLLALAAPPLIALQLEVARWVALVSALPLLCFLMLDSEKHPDEHLLGEGFNRIRGWVLAVVLIVDVILGGGLLTVAGSMM